MNDFKFTKQVLDQKTGNLHTFVSYEESPGVIAIDEEVEHPDGTHTLWLRDEEAEVFERLQKEWGLKTCGEVIAEILRRVE